MRKKPKKDVAHPTKNDYCCACEYDILCMKEKIKEAYSEGFKKGVLTGRENYKHR